MNVNSRMDINPSVLLLIVAIDWVMRLTTRGLEGIVWIEKGRLSDADLSSDTAAFADTTKGLQCLVESINRYADSLGHAKV